MTPPDIPRPIAIKVRLIVDGRQVDAVRQTVMLSGCQAVDQAMGNLLFEITRDLSGDTQAKL